MATIAAFVQPFTAKEILNGKKNAFIRRENKLWLVIDSSNTGFAQFEKFMEFLKKEWAIEEHKFINMHMALSEAISNAIDHGNKCDEAKSVYVCAKRDEEYFGFSVEDEGEGFNYRKIENPTDADKRKKAHGRGIFIMNYLTENLHYSDNGKCVKLLFSRTR